LRKMILVTGGARSGKSRFAERLADGLSARVLYVATAKDIDSEMTERIAHHRRNRPPTWTTYEGYKQFETAAFVDLAKQYEVVLVDCLTILCTNLIMEQFEEPIDDNTLLENAKAEAIEKKVLIEVNGLMNALEDAGVTAIFVTNEVGMGLVPEYPLGRLFRDVAGRVNQRVADRATEVHFCVSGLPIKIK